MKRFVSGVCTSLFLIGAILPFAGCSANIKREHEVIKETDKWYSCNEIDIAANCNALNYKHFTFFTPVVIDGLVVATYNAYDDMYSDEAHDPICIFDPDGNLLKEFEITEELPMSRKVGVVKDGDGMAVYYQSMGKLYKADINSSTYAIENNREIDIGGETVQFANCMSCEGYVFAVGTKKGENYLYVFKDEALIFCDKMFIEYPVLHSVASKDGGFQLMNYSSLFFYDPAKNELKSEGMTYTHSVMRNEVIGSDGRNYEKKADGIYVNDEPYVMYSDTDCNVYRFMISDLLAVTDDTIVLNLNLMQYGTETPQIMYLKKEATNPHAGKTVIRARSYGNCIDTMTGEAIRKFNNESREYFVRYASVSQYIISDEEFAEKYEKGFREEIISSDAADIYFGVDTLWWFQSEDYFVDLKKELQLDTGDYYTKILDSASREGKLFYMPLAYAAEGLWTDASNVKDGARGFTYDEYVEFVSTVGNGKDAISQYFPREEYFFMCFSMMNDTWFKNGEVNIANSEFESMCEYFKENVSENPTITEEQFISGEFTAVSGYMFDATGPEECCHLLGRYDDPVMLGLPTSDGRGPAAVITNSVAVSAVSDLKEGCISFIRTLISKDIQEKCSDNPINRNALPAVIDRYGEIFKYEYKVAGFTSESDAARYNYYFLTDEMKAAYIANMEKVEVVSASDPSIRALVSEELSEAYSGQKDVKDVAASLEKRLKTLYSEKYSR